MKLARFTKTGKVLNNEALSPMHMPGLRETWIKNNGPNSVVGMTDIPTTTDVININHCNVEFERQVDE